MTLEVKSIELEITPTFRNFDWEKAKSFYYVSKFGSFMGAARFLNISQSALSRQVNHLEYHLGYPLLGRHSGGVKLTRKGKELFDIIEKVFLELKGFTDNTVLVGDKSKKNNIRISATHAYAVYILKEHLFYYTQLHPDITFEVITDDHFIDVLINDVDFSIRPFNPHAVNVHQEFLSKVEKRLFASPNYLEKFGEPQSAEDLDVHHIIAPAKPEIYPYADVLWILKVGMPLGRMRNPIFSSNSIELLVEAAKLGLGIIASYQEMTIIRDSNLKQILPSLKGPLNEDFIIYPDYVAKNKTLMDFKEFLINRISKK